MNHKHHLAALGAIAAGTALAISGVYVLAGGGWALLAGAVPCFGVAGVILKGLHHG